MNELTKIVKRKKRATFLKIYIKTDDFKLNVIPIPLWLTKGTLTMVLRMMKVAMRFNKNNHSSLNQADITDILLSIKSIINEIKSYPPFSIVEIESHDTKIVIKTK